MMPEAPFNQITVYEVQKNFNGTQGSFIITATQKVESKSGGNSSQRSQSKEGTGSNEDRAGSGEQK